MCGICGVVRNDSQQVERSLVEKMNSRLTHRGPDGEGYFFSSGVGLGMRRLAVIDLNTGDQPISNEDETIWIVFNGEIFNYQKLRSDLEKGGHTLKTQSDTECIAHLYEEHGDDCVNFLRGQFAFAIWDTENERLFVARDRLGQKPFYYMVRQGHFYFSSELSGLLSIVGATPEISLPALDLYLSLQYIPEPLTPYKGIYKLPAAHVLRYDRKGVYISPYWQLEYEPKNSPSEPELMEELRIILSESVKMRMISDVPLGAHLSGGIDSSIVVALMAEASSLPVKTFSVGFEESSFSELGYARALADRYQTDHHEFTMTYGDIPTTLEILLDHFGEPIADPSAIPLYHLSKMTREFVTVALNGDGGDEAFAGYQRYWLDPYANLYNRMPQMLTERLVPFLVQKLPDRQDQPIGTGLVNGLKRLGQISTIDSRASILRWGSYFSPQWKKRLWKVPLEDQAESYLTDLFDSAQAVNFLDRTLSTDIHAYLSGDLLVKADRMTMASSLEGRSPFLDHKLAEWAARLPKRMKVRGFTGKYLLRKAFADKLPSDILDRGKQGFGIPVGSWFRGPLAGWAREILLDGGSLITEWFKPQEIQKILDDHQSARENHGKRIYALIMLALWANRK
jgi:asparagine synthase (glutamine-hydrolysing)